MYGTLQYLVFQALFNVTISKYTSTSDRYLIDAIFGRNQAVSEGVASDRTGATVREGLQDGPATSPDMLTAGVCI